MTLRIGLSIDPSMPRFLDVARQAERIGVDSVWVAEYWAYDAFTPLAAVAAVTERLRLATGIAQLGARTPAMLAMTAQGVQAVSDGRLILGIGTSGPQVMEGWHGVPFDRPVQRTRETIEIVRMITAGERLSYDGSVYRLPLPDSAGRAIRSRADAAPIPDLRRVARPGQPGAHRGAGRRVDRQLVLHRERGGVLRPDRRGCGTQLGAASTTSTASSPCRSS